MSRPHSDPLIRDLAAIVGAAHVIATPEELHVYAYDGLSSGTRPRAVVLPGSTEEVAAVVRLCHREGLPFLARGAGTGLSGGAQPTQAEVVISTGRLRRILEIDAENRTAVVEPGVVNLHLSEAVAGDGLFYAPDPSSQRACTIGGNVAENSGGPHCLFYGVTTNHVLGLEVVLPDGEVVWLGGKAPDAPGYDLVGVFVGSEGTLGVVTKVIVKLLPRPEAVKTFLASFATMEAACRAVSAIIAAGIVPAALEIMDRVSMDAVEASLHAGYPVGAGAVLLVEVEGMREDVAAQDAAVEAICRREAALEIRAAETEAAREALWAGRKGALGALGHLSPNYFIQDGVVPRSRLPEIMALMEDVARRHEVVIANVLHAGDGNLHPNILYDARQPGAKARVEAAGAEIMRACLEMGGTLSGEHGIGLDKAKYMDWLFSADDQAWMQSLKCAFNPDNRCNPGKIFPTPRSCGELLGRPLPAGLTAADIL
jgi:glycolate oxidase